MAHNSVGINIFCKDLGDGVQSLFFEGDALGARLLQRSATLRRLLQLEGDATLSIRRSSFIIWTRYSHLRSYSLSELADLTEVRVPINQHVLTPARCITSFLYPTVANPRPLKDQTHILD